MLSRSNWSAVSNGRLYLMYMAAGVAAIPIGVLYSVLSLHSVLPGWEEFLLLGGGLVSALFIWQLLERKFACKAAQIETPVAQISNEKAQNIYADRLAWVAVATTFRSDISAESNTIETPSSYAIAWSARGSLG